jgi:septal ring factor EnvC (AmiA/AmiB activator)
MNEAKVDKVKNLEYVRDELNLKSHLFMAEVKDQWEKLEKEFAHLKSEIGTVTRAAGRSAEEVKAASELLVESLEKGYTRIKNTIT